MTRALRVSPEAEEEILVAAAWYETRRSGLGVDFVAALDEALEDVLENPTRYAIWSEGLPYRKRSLRGFPYVIFYMAGDDVDVLAVAHARRRPGHWLARPEPAR